MNKHEWRKNEKKFYLPKDEPQFIEVPEFKFITIKGEGSPQEKSFAEYIGVLYALAYAVKMNLKKEQTKPKGYMDFTVYPLEGIWDINEEAKKKFDGTFDKKDLVFKLMIRQPEFVTKDYVSEMVELVKKKNPHPLLKQIIFEKISDGSCIQMLHIGSYENEPVSFELMEKFAEKNKLNRLSKKHREIYLSDFRKVDTDKLKTVLRFKVKAK